MAVLNELLCNVEYQTEESLMNMYHLYLKKILKELHFGEKLQCNIVH